MEIKHKKPFYKQWWFILIAIAFVMGAIGNAFESDETKQKEENKINAEDKKKEKVDLNIEIEITETIIDDKNVTIIGETNIIDGAILDYQLRATMGETEVTDGKFEISESVKILEEDDADGFYGDGSEYPLLILFPSFGSTSDQPEHVQKAYGDYGEKIKKGPNLKESNGSKYVSLELEFGKDGMIDPKDKKEKEFKEAIKEWDESYKKQMLDHYSDAGVIDIRENPGSDWDVVYVYVPNEFKMSTEGEKQYYVDEIGPLIESDITSHFKKDHEVHVHFKYEDGNDMASRKMLGGWKIK